jgi:hypothetical protein
MQVSESIENVEEGDKNSSSMLIMQIKLNQGCYTRFWDQIFLRFAHGDKTKADGQSWITLLDFLSFCEKVTM